MSQQTPARYSVGALGELVHGAPLTPDVRYAVYEALEAPGPQGLPVPHGKVAIAYTYTQDAAEQIARLLNEERRP